MLMSGNYGDVAIGDYLQKTINPASAGPLPLWTKIANAWHLDSLFEFVRERSGLKHFDA